MNLSKVCPARRGAVLFKLGRELFECLVFLQCECHIPALLVNMPLHKVYPLEFGKAFIQNAAGTAQQGNVKYSRGSDSAFQGAALCGIYSREKC
jgi:hypothetical protein